jgi:hypothetical protein
MRKAHRLLGQKMDLRYPQAFSASHNESIAKSNFHSPDLSLNEVLQTLWFDKETSSATPNEILQSLKSGELREAMTTFPVRSDYPPEFKQEIEEKFPEWRQQRQASVEKMAADLEARIKLLGKDKADRPLEEVKVEFDQVGKRAGVGAPKIPPPVPAAQEAVTGPPAVQPPSAPAQEPGTGVKPASSPSAKPTVRDYMMAPATKQEEFALLRSYHQHVETAYGKETATHWLNRTDIENAIALADKWKEQRPPAQGQPAQSPPQTQIPPPAPATAPSIAPTAVESPAPQSSPATADSGQVKTPKTATAADPTVEQIMQNVARTEQNIQGILKEMKKSDDRLSESARRLEGLSEQLEAIEVPSVAGAKSQSSPKRGK